MVQPSPCYNLTKHLKIKSSVFAKHSWVKQPGITRWLFRPGMLFGAKQKWWESEEARQSMHEGLDFYAFLDAQGSHELLDTTFHIPVLFDGEIVSVFDDFLGKTILVKHEQFQVDEKIFCTIYGHVSPLSTIQTGFQISAGDSIATIAAPEFEKSKVPPHLHLSTAFVPNMIITETVDWKSLSRPPVMLCDPLDILEVEYKQVEML